MRSSSGSDTGSSNSCCCDGTKGERGSGIDIGGMEGKRILIGSNGPHAIGVGVGMVGR